MKHPRDAALHQSLGTLLERQGDRAAARASYRAAVAHAPHAPAYVAWALLESKEGNLDEARRLFDAGRKVDPGRVTLILTLALSPTRTLPQTRPQPKP